MSSSKASAPRRLKLWEGLFQALTSLKLSISCLALLMVLVVACTLAEVSWGTYGAVQATMHSFFVWLALPGTSWKIPVFPGGGLVGGLLLVNLFASQFVRLERSWRKAGLWVVHFGLILLFVGEFLTGFFQVETQMPIAVGQSRSYAESSRQTELALLDTTEPSYDQVYSVSEEALRREGPIEDRRLPFSLDIRRFYPNASFEMNRDGSSSPATAGIGPSIKVVRLPPVTDDEHVNQPAAFVSVKAPDKDLGTWLASSGLGAPQEFAYGGRTYRLALRPRRYYLPFSLTLKQFRHEIYPGTDIPSHFSSVLRLEDPARGESRDVVISMNHPLRYAGKALYQASFAEGDRVSVLQVVENPSWTLPYLACVLVALGLLYHFAWHLRGQLSGARA